ncbi:aliphatic sulfonate ABC transporter substrate-binding protein [Streptomyces sp. NPDC002835]
MPATRTFLGRGLAAAAALPLLAVVLTACGYGSQAVKAPVAHAAKGPRVGGLDTVRIGYFPNLTHATALVGDREGILQRELGGTKVSTASFNAGPSEIEALNAGSIDIGFIGPSPAVNAYVKSSGESLRIIGGSASGGVKLVVNPEKITSPADVEGKRIATPQLGNTQDVAFLNWAAEQGWKIDPQSGKGDVSAVRMQPKVTPGAYRSGAIDGAWMPEPAASRLVAAGAKVLVDEADLWPDGKFVITNIVVSQKFLKAHPAVVEAVLRGTVKTNAWINAHPDEAKEAANAKLQELTGKPLPPEVIDPAWKSLRFTDDPLAATLDAQADHAVRAGLLEQPDLAGIYDLKPLNKVLGAAGAPEVSDAGLGVK